MVNKQHGERRSITGILIRLTFGNLAYLGAQFVAFVALAHWSSIAEVGRFSWALALTGPIFIFADMRTGQIQLSTPQHQVPYRTFWLQRLLAQMIAAPVAVILGVLFAPDRDTLVIVIGLVALKFLEGFINVSIAEYMRVEETGRVAAIQVTRGIFYASVFSVAVYVSGSAATAVWCTAAALLLPTAYGHWSLPRSTRARASSWSGVVSLTRESWAIGLGFFVGSVTVNGPRFLIEAFHGVESLGVFAAVFYVIILANTVVDSVTQGLMPRFSFYWRTGKIRRALVGAFRICVLVGVIGLLALLVSALAGGPLLALLYGPEYADGRPVLVALFTYATLQYVSSALRSVLIAGGMRGGVFWISFFTLTVTMAFAAWWVPGGGPESAGWALAVGQLTQMSVYFWLSGQHWRAAEPRKELTS